MLLTLLCGAPRASRADSATAWRYDVRAGDHLVYREIMQQEIDDHNVIHLDTEHVRKLRLLLRPDLFDRAGDVRVVLNGKTVFTGPVAIDCAVYARSWAASHDPYLAYSSELTFDVAH